jgi:hypothetical protein
VVRLVIPRGSDPPHAIDGSKIYVRDEADTNLAVRDEIVALVRRALADEAPPLPVEPPPPEPGRIEAPRTGVEIIHSVVRKGETYHQMRDLRNNNVVKNVTRKSARRLWHYAITEKEEHPVDPAKVRWEGQIALLKSRKRGGVTRYDLAQRDGENVRVYYGVTEDGIGGEWRKLVPHE